ncbi:TIGR00375 family protein [Caldanaerobius fijiensis DSM 17918]|uniref:TIGR00375 family protein n=1 Tax=Caldanaerobius fijiensis DSM 17918 TaxID=1121256 RepID=A0A1M4UA32_9THEO|nr:endonuclease Q family protein [Caldanaerobius fijiensis]SHE53589.1 TIGR00375 family protein [Caldanaerobius fijiensis DSM 17918]
MNNFSADLHVHIGSSKEKVVKITASRDLTLLNTIKECELKKGINIVGIVDCLVPSVLSEIKELIYKGLMDELQDGGFRCGKTTVIVGAELELTVGDGVAHCLCFFPGLSQITAFASYIKNYIKNINLSTQRCYLSIIELVKAVLDHDGIFIPAHVFTPFKSLYGNCTDSLTRTFDKYYDKIYAIELGLSADSNMADMLKELNSKVFLSNSDAHSLNKIAREFNIFYMIKPTFAELLMVLQNREGRKIIANYGLDPRLGKYHRTYCLKCNMVVDGQPPQHRCNKCGSTEVVIGVLDRLMTIKDQEVIHPTFRPKYIYNMPLEFIPGIGKVTRDKLLDYFHSELYVLHNASFDEIQKVAGKKAAENIIRARKGAVSIKAGGGGVYGHINI